ncbi:hypothetical protein R6Y95_02105 [Methanoculleus palmolei]|uniref:N-acetyltransferase domain-containing protein n=1 Tax=Methanoculleus palmolei TaxID=72612 RepID=A0ABD8A9F3_9EURY|nr:hypothetical protein R6Y95_02105 [Methanoculleus palmolei]
MGLPLPVACFGTTSLFCEKLGPAKNSHDAVDNALLYAVYRNAVEFFITEDREIHKKAHTVGIEERVFLISEALYDFNRYLPSRESIPTPPALVKDSMYNLNPRDPIFDSLRVDYPGFDEWFIDKAQEGRECYVYSRTDGSIGAILIYKIEDEPIPSIPPFAKKKRLKIATMKVEHVGYKIGELLLKVSIDIALKNSITEIYLTHFTQSEEDRLVDLISEYGFYKAGGLQRENKIEDIYVKHLCARGHDVSALLPATISQIYYPSFYDGTLVKKFVIPIQPKYHDLLFTDFSKGRQTKLYEHSGEFIIEGNTIRKAYLTEVIPKHLSREGDAFRRTSFFSCTRRFAGCTSRSLPRVAIPREEPYQRFDARDHSIFHGEATKYSEL